MPLLEVARLDKRFGPSYALRDVSLTVEPGQVHGLVGENGAGKSTLIKVVTGVYRPDAGRLVWDGRETSLASPRLARELGISAVHQDRQLVMSFTALENLYLGAGYPAGRFWPGVAWRRMRAEAETLQIELGLALPLGRLAQDLSPTERTMLEILRAVRTRCRLLVLDEPTASLTDREAETLFALVARLRAQGTAVVYVSHRLEEVLRLADRVTVLRNGEVAASLNRAEASRDGLVSLMSGASAAPVRAQRPAMGGKRPVLLEVASLSTRDGRVRNASLTVREGEVVGVFGLAGAGRTELLEAIYGARARTAGRVTLGGRALAPGRPATSLTRGLVHIPEDRRAHGLVMGMTVRENLTLPRLSSYTRSGIIGARRERHDVEGWMASLRVRARSAEQVVSELSGGNQQKVVFARALALKPAVLLCDEPTQAVDVTTREAIHELLREQAGRSRGVVFVSSDVAEVIEVADRVVVMHEGRTVADLPSEGLTPEKILSVCYGHQNKLGHGAD